MAVLGADEPPRVGIPAAVFEPTLQPQQRPQRRAQHRPQRFEQDAATSQPAGDPGQGVRPIVLLVPK